MHTCIQVKQRSLHEAGRTQRQALAVAKEVRGCAHRKRKLQPWNIVARHPRRFRKALRHAQESAGTFLSTKE